MKKEIKDYWNNDLKIIVNNFHCEYYECGSHKMELTIEIDKEQLINFLDQIEGVSYSFKEEKK